LITIIIVSRETIILSINKNRILFL